MALSLNTGSQIANVSTGTSLAIATGITANAGDICVLLVGINGGSAAVSITGVAGGGLTWTKRAGTTLSDEFANHDVLEWWWAYTVGSQSALIPTVTLSANISGGGGGHAGCVAFSVTGFSGGNYSTNPWDTTTWNVAYTGTNITGTGTIPTLTGFSTANAAAMVLGLVVSDDSTTQTAASTYALIQTEPSNPSTSAEYQVFSSLQSSISVAFGTLASNWRIVADALTPLGAAGATVAFQLGTDVQSSGLAALALANKIVILSGSAPTSYANANTNTLGVMAFGIGNCFGAASDNSGPPANMQISSIAVTAGSVTVNGTPTCWAVLDDVNSRLLAWGPLTGAVAVTIGQSWTLASFTIQVPVQ